MLHETLILKTLQQFFKKLKIYVNCPLKSFKKIPNESYYLLHFLNIKYFNYNLKIISQRVCLILRNKFILIACALKIYFVERSNRLE